MGYFPDRPAPPGWYNTYRGLPIKPEPGPCDDILRYIFHVLCSSNKKMVGYFLSLLAKKIQNPGWVPGVCVVFVGPEGTGKSKLSELLEEIFGVGLQVVTDPKDIAGTFNSRLRDAEVIFVDEAAAVSDSVTQGIINARITGKWHKSEAKYESQEQARNHAWIIVASNNEIVFKTREDARRYLMIPRLDLLSKE